MTPQELVKIKETAQEFFRQTGLAIEVDIKNPVDSTVPITLTAEDPQFLIGEGGQTLVEIQRLLKAIIRRKIDSSEPFYIDVDVNDYKKKKIEYLKETARTTADEVSLSKKEIALAAMSSYERRIIHTELASRTDVVTESIGGEPERKIVVKPRS